MADSTRRSGRATKGQHSKKEEIDEAPASKKTSKGRKKVEEEEPEEVIRCICGDTEEDESGRTMVACDKCSVWQHNECMEIEDELADDYKFYCEQCRPDLHKALLAKVARGERPWEERARQRELEEEEEARGKKGRGRKGKKGGKQMSVKKSGDTNGAAADADRSQVEAATEIASETATPVTENNKRKLPDQLVQDSRSPIHAEPPTKTRKVSSPPASKVPAPTSRRKSGAPPITKRDSSVFTLQMNLVTDIADIESEARRKVAGDIVRMFIEETKKAVKAGSFSLPEGQTAEAFGNTLGLSVEYAIYLNFWGTKPMPSEEYSTKYRTVRHNVKSNNALRDQLLTGTLPPNEFSKMSGDDMAPKALQEEKAKMKQESERQQMLVQEEGPRVRRTHKGEEIVEDQNDVAGASDSAFIAPIRKRPSDIDTTMRDITPEPISAVSPAAVELPENVGPTDANRPLSVDTQGSPPQSAASVSTSKFDINNVWDQTTVKTPDTENQRPRQASRTLGSSAPPVAQQADPEIDQLLKDEEPEDDEPYSPVDTTAEPESAVWSGKLTMPSVAGFKGKARHCAGADLSSSMPWNQLIPSLLGIEGRIDIDRASAYLCGLKWSTTTDVVVVSVTPDNNENDITQFNKLFKYFTERNRYGVIGKNLNISVKDTYVVPLEAGSSKKPDFVELLDVCTIEDPTPERMLLLSFVVKLGNSPGAQQTPRHMDAASVASPIGASGQAPPLGSHPGLQNTPTPSMPYQPPPNYSQYGSPMQGQNPYPLPPNHQQGSYPPPYPTYTGMDAAKFVFGDLANLPAVATLVTNAPGSDVQALMVVKTTLDSNPALRNDYPAMLAALKVQTEKLHR